MGISQSLNTLFSKKKFLLINFYDNFDKSWMDVLRETSAEIQTQVVTTAIWQVKFSCYEY